MGLDRRKMEAELEAERKAKAGAEARRQALGRRASARGCGTPDRRWGKIRVSLVASFVDRLGGIFLTAWQFRIFSCL
jgi:hypothetical protein